jgi:hypothetical protein
MSDRTCLAWCSHCNDIPDRISMKRINVAAIELHGETFLASTYIQRTMEEY